jgi:hypothetical protein
MLRSELEQKEDAIEDLGQAMAALFSDRTL